MNSKQFNKKYEQYLEKGYYGGNLGEGKVYDYLDNEFQELIKIPGFSYRQIKLKFGYGSFYCSNVPTNKIAEIEKNITKICNEKIMNTYTFQNSKGNIENIEAENAESAWAKIDKKHGKYHTYHILRIKSKRIILV